jgi:hypothetical protein
MQSLAADTTPTPATLEKKNTSAKKLKFSLEKLLFNNYAHWLLFVPNTKSAITKNLESIELSLLKKFEDDVGSRLSASSSTSSKLQEETQPVQNSTNNMDGMNVFDEYVSLGTIKDKDSMMKDTPPSKLVHKLI